MSESGADGRFHHAVSPAVLLSMTAVTGLVDAVSFLGLGHVFTANMTGNVVFLGFALGGAPGLSAPRSLVALGCFFIGAVAGGRISTERAPRAIAAEAVLLMAAAWIASPLVPPYATTSVETYGVVITTAAAMGIHGNAKSFERWRYPI